MNISIITINNTHNIKTLNTSNENNRLLCILIKHVLFYMYYVYVIFIHVNKSCIIIHVLIYVEEILSLKPSLMFGVCLNLHFLP